MPLQLLQEDDNTFTVDAGDGPQQIAKTPQVMAPGGLYAQAKASSTDIPSAPTDVNSLLQQNIQPHQEAVIAPTESANSASPEQLNALANKLNAPPQPPQTPTLLQAPQPAQPSPDEPQPVPVPQPQQPQTPQLTVPITDTATSTKQAVYDPKAMGEVQSQYNNVATAEENKGDIESKAAVEQAKLANEKAKIHNQDAIDAQAQADKMQQLQDQYNKQMPALIDDYMKSGIKPKPIFEDNNIGQNVTAGLAIMLGGLGAALTGSKENAGLKVINDAIERDMKVQQFNLEKKREGINMLGVAYKNALSMGMDTANAKKMVSGYALDSVADKLEAVAASSNSDLVKQNAAASAARLRAEAAAKRAEATKAETATTTQTKQMPITKLMPQQKLGPDQQKSLLSYQNNDRNYKEISDLYDLATAKSMTGPIEGRYQKFLADHPGLANADSATLQAAIQNEMITKMHELFGSRITDPEVQQMLKVIPDIRDRPGAFRSKLQLMWKKNSDEYNGLLKNYPYQRDFTAQPLIYDQLNPKNTSFQPN